MLERETRFEPATFTLARWRSTTELFPHIIRTVFCWWKLQGSNLWPSACKADALPAELNFHPLFAIVPSKAYILYHIKKNIASILHHFFKKNLKFLKIFFEAVFYCFFAGKYRVFEAFLRLRRGKSLQRKKKFCSRVGIFCGRGIQSLRHGKPCHLPLHKGGKGGCDKSWIPLYTREAKGRCDKSWILLYTREAKRRCDKSWIPLYIRGSRGKVTSTYLYIRARVKIKNFFTNYVNFCLEAEKSVYI